MTTKRALLGLLIVTLMAACGDKEKSDSSGAGAGAAGMTAGATAGTTAGTGAAGSTAGTAAVNCTAPEGPTMCGTEACTAPDAASAANCFRTCCTADTKCGTVNGLIPGGACTIVPVNNSSCPNETILNQMATGCCIESSQKCGVINTTGFGPAGCIAREMVPIMPLSALNCDGTVPAPTAGTGAAGTGAAGEAAAGTGAAGMGG
jgi:hypothetical protein